MTKLEILKSVDKVLTSDVLDSFYSISFRNGNNVTLQGKYHPETMKKVNNAFGLDMTDWSVSQGGYMNLHIDGSSDVKRFIVDEERIDVEITLTN